MKPTRVAAPSPRASLGRRTVCGRTEQRRPPVSKRYETKVRMVWGSFLIAAAALKTPTRNCYNIITPKAPTLYRVSSSSPGYSLAPLRVCRGTRGQHRGAAGARPNPRRQGLQGEQKPLPPRHGTRSSVKGTPSLRWLPV